MESSTTCSHCSGVVRFRDKFQLHLCMAVICDSCSSHEQCNICDRPMDLTTTTVINARSNCDFCEMEAIWNCSCHDVVFCSSCLLISHDNDFHGKSISKIMENEQNVTCNSCNTLPADYTSASSNVCIFCLPKQKDAKNYKRINTIEPQQVHLLLEWLEKLKKDSIRDLSTSIDIVKMQHNDINSKIERAMKEIKDMIEYNEELIMDLKARDQVLKKLCNNFNIFDFLAFSISQNRINHDFLVNVLANIPDASSKFTFYEINLKANIVDLDELKIISMDDNQAERELTEMTSEYDASLPKRARNFSHENDDNCHDDNDSNAVSLFAFEDQNVYRVKIVYYRSPLYVIVTIPGLDELRDKIIAKIRGMKFMKIVNAQVQVGDIVILYDKPLFGYPYKRARITRILGKEITVKQIDHGPVLNVTIDKIFSCPSDLSSEPETVARISLMHIAPKSKFAFIQPTKGTSAHDFMRDKLVPKDKMISIKRLYATTQTIFCKVCSNIQGQEVDWAKELLKANIAVPFHDYHGCFQPKQDYCYMFHVLTCAMGNKCYRSHICPYCDHEHALQNCQKFKLD